MRRMYSKPQLLEAVEEESKLKGIKVFEDIVDKDGHPRFIEGDIEFQEAYAESISVSYAKWSLSGSHLMLVVSGYFIEGATASSGVFAVASLPKWIHDKIYPTFNNYLEFKITNLYADNITSTGTANLALIKSTNNEMSIGCATNVTPTGKGNFRIQFDLLIDNE